LGAGQGRRQGRFALKGRTLARHSSASWNPALLCSPARHSRMLLAGIQCLCFLFFFKSKGFHSSSGRAAYFLCSCKESRQRNTPQRIAPFGHRAQRVRVIGRVPLIAHPVQQRNRRDPSRRPFGPDRPLPPQCHGAPGRAKRARPARRSQSKAAFVVVLDPGPRQPRQGQAGIARQGRAQGCARVREWAECPSSEPRPDLAHPQRVARRARLPGGVLFGYFLLHKQEKVTRSHGCERKNEGMRPPANQEQRHWIPASAGMTS